MFVLKENKFGDKIHCISDAVKDVGNYSTPAVITVFLMQEKKRGKTINLPHFRRETMIDGHYGDKNKLKTNISLNRLFETRLNALHSLRCT